jgi:hypothetical protein
MTITLDSQLEAALEEQAQQQGISAEHLAVTLLKKHLNVVTILEPRDEWEQTLLAAARPWGVSLSDEALSSEGLYD